MIVTRHIAAAWLVAALSLAGCEQRRIVPPPADVTAYQLMRRRQPPDYPDRTVLLYNLRRVSDGGLPAQQRKASLELVISLGRDNPVVGRELMAILSDPASPPELHAAALEFLLRRGDPEIAVYALKALENPRLSGPLREAILQWLSRHAQPEVLAQVVKLWAQEPSTTTANEPRYRQIVEQIAGRPWDEALIAGVNTERFFARGSAMEVLTARLDPRVLRERLMRLTPGTVAIAALQEFIRRFDYLPANGTEFLAAAAIFATRRDTLPRAADLSRQWQDMFGYRFNVRDLHLIGRLARDPLRKPMARAELIVQLTRRLGARRHLDRRPRAGDPPGSHLDGFAEQIEQLTMADLWNLALLEEMLSRDRVQLALRIMADNDRQDTTTAHGGLVFYEGGKAEAKLFEPGATGDDTRYVPAPALIEAGRDALCRFHGHFEKPDNVARAGPDGRELTEARKSNSYGLVLTSLSEDTFTAHYYNPRGVVVSLGVYPMGGG